MTFYQLPFHSLTMKVLSRSHSKSPEEHLKINASYESGVNVPLEISQD
jgi:hypothetical protein